MAGWKKARRQEYLETKEYRYYIFCEGEQTEPEYFQGFKKMIEKNPIYRDMVLIEIEPCGAETLRVIGQAEKYVKENKMTRGQIWCVYDKDSFPARDFNGVIARAETLNRQNTNVQYHTAWSNECIEFWFSFISQTIGLIMTGVTMCVSSMKRSENWVWAATRRIGEIPAGRGEGEVYSVRKAIHEETIKSCEQ